jgi:hypothetical protein
MRRVRRRSRQLIKPPWEQRGTDAKGRTLLTNVKDPVLVQNPDGDTVELGLFDRMYRIYRHSGVSPKQVAADGGIRYFRHEWEFLLNNNCLWIEFVHPSTGSVMRIDWNSARRYGSAVTNQWGQMWSVPEHLFEGNHL